MTRGSSYADAARGTCRRGQDCSAASSGPLPAQGLPANGKDRQVASRAQATMSGSALNKRSEGPLLCGGAIGVIPTGSHPAGAAVPDLDAEAASDRFDARWKAMSTVPVTPPERSEPSPPPSPVESTRPRGGHGTPLPAARAQQQVTGWPASSVFSVPPAPGEGPPDA